MDILEFKANPGQKIRGKGCDGSGEFIIKGKKVKDDGVIKFKKSYQGDNLYTVTYQGEIQGDVITGQWNLGDQTGDFRLSKVKRL